MGHFVYDTEWSATVESDKEWGIHFRKIVILMLILRKKLKSNLLPKPIIFKILQLLSASYIEQKYVPWELEQQNTQKLPDTKDGFSGNNTKWSFNSICLLF